ncbi:YfbU family protein [Ewingella americana]|uniref:YfbU family protein n=1 Tax=Ewingella americana TaxID=41202 RepID=UPI0012ADC47C|nr:YfbU family protein [Ewingella americana]MRT04070.1 hypothetical protein [Ewingella americana]
MKISGAEKLILTMLCDISESQTKKGKVSDVDPAFVREALDQDCSWALQWQYSGLLGDDGSNPPYVKQVADILDMWDQLEDHYEELSEDEKTLLIAKASLPVEGIKFKGFDGNNETNLMVTARFFVKSMNMFERFEKRNMNSHSPSLDMHLRMLKAYQGLTSFTLGVDELADVMNARKYQ